MPLFCKKEVKGDEYKARLEHKLYLARENPEPVFDLSDCGLKLVPPGIYSLCKVFRKEKLYLQDNLLTSLAGGGKMQDLSLLQVLDLHSNSLSELPDELKHLKNLRELNVAGNQLTSLPDVICEMKNLCTLILSDNYLKALPASLGSLHSLCHLDIRNNKDLSSLPLELCKVSALKELHLSPEYFTCPPQDVAQQGTVSILKFLAAEYGVDYDKFEREMAGSDASCSTSFQDQVPEEKLQERRQKERLALEKQIEEHQKRELDLRFKTQRSKEKLLEDLVHQQSKLEHEISRIRQGKEAERQQLLQELQQEETTADSIISQLLSLNSSERRSTQLQQLLEREREEEVKILNVRQEEYRDLRHRDILNAMETLLEEECLREKKLREYEEGRWLSTKTLLDQEVENNKHLEERLMNYSQVNMELVGRLQKDDALQRAAVATLLERGDTRSWGLVQQVRLVESQLAAVTSLEMKRRSLKYAEHMEDLCKKRIALSELLVDLLVQQDVRRKELLSTLNEMERRRWLEQEEKGRDDFWLRQYQRLLDTRSGCLMELERSLDPALAHQLILNGVIHCLPFLVRWITSPDKLAGVTDDSLIEVGISSYESRKAVLKAVENYLRERDTGSRSTAVGPLPSAPAEIDEDLGNTVIRAECVVCMELSCEVIFLPCGHMCCCTKCSELVNDCPMCRRIVDQKIRVIIP